MEKAFRYMAVNVHSDTGLYSGRLYRMVNGDRGRDGEQRRDEKIITEWRRSWNFCFSLKLFSIKTHTWWRRDGHKSFLLFSIDVYFPFFSVPTWLIRAGPYLHHLPSTLEPSGSPASVLWHINAMRAMGLLLHASCKALIRPRTDILDLCRNETVREPCMHLIGVFAEHLEKRIHSLS